MKINWKVRLQSKTFLVAAFSLLLLLVQQVANLFGIDTTIYNERVTDIFNTVLAILVLIGVVHDPTTTGLSDSEQALGYHKPRDDLDGEQK
ncbi:phage holin [Lysinibacillus antri]|uniref:Phage holin n=1 Tax=Lysinibacillus antri TaxID=2498145 RepID=A0A3S0QRT9_9BACI|nr:phage holin [Lysinibacillus antri]RUL56448.1 phage holin [Lysinibacillus antri]